MTKHNPITSHIYQAKIRAKVIEFMGGVCCKCGFDDPRALQIDHIMGNGNKDRAKTNWYSRYKKILNGEDKSCQLLCANCNWIKRAEEKRVYTNEQIYSYKQLVKIYKNRSKKEYIPHPRPKKNYCEVVAYKNNFDHWKKTKKLMQKYKQSTIGKV